MFYGRVLNIQAAGPGKTALIMPGLGATYDKFILTLGGGLAAADIEEVRIKANDVEIFVDSGVNLNLRQAYKGIATDAGELVIDFTEPHARGDASQQYMASLPANLLKKLVIEVDIADDEGMGEDFTKLGCAAEYRGPTQNPFILKRRLVNDFMPAAGRKDLILPSGFSGGMIKRVWMHDGGKVDAAQLIVGKMYVLDFEDIAELSRVQERNGLVPQENIDVLDFIADGNLNGILDTTKYPGDIALRLTASEAEPLQLYIDYIDPISRLK